MIRVTSVGAPPSAGPRLTPPLFCLPVSDPFLFDGATRQR